MGCKKLLLGTSAFALGAVQLFADDVSANTVKMPDGVDIPSLIQSGVTVLAGIVAVALAAWASWLLVKVALKWIRKSLT